MGGYIVKYGEELLHDPRGETVLASPEVDVEVNAAGTFTFKITADHPLAGVIAERDTSNPVTVWQEGKLLFYGDILSIGSDFQNTRQVTCRGELGWLNDSIVRPYSTKEDEQGEAAPPTVDGYFEWLVAQHNKQVERTKRFTVGINQGSSLDANNYIYRSNSAYPNTGAELKEKLLEELGGYVQARHEGGVRYIDLLADFDKVNAQTIEFGANLLDFAKNDATDDMATFVIPVGAKMSETDYDYDDGYFVTKDSKPSDKKEYYTRRYSKCAAMTAFQSGVTYYEKKEAEFKTSDSKPFSGVDYYLKKWTAQFNKASVKKSFTEGKTYYQHSSDKGYYVTSHSSPQSGVTYYTQIAEFREGTTYYQYSSADGYYKTSHSKPQKGVTYYTLKWEKQSISKFEEGKTYWEKETYYAVTSDAEPKSSKTYYTLDRSNYSKASSLGRFLKYETYFEYDKYADESDNRLNLTRLGDDFLGGDWRKQGDKIYSDAATLRHGWIGAVVEFDDVTDVETLQRKGLAAAKGLVSPVRTVEVTALDLAMIDPTLEPIFKGQYVRAVSRPHGFDSYMLCTAVHLNLERPDLNVYTLGTTFDVLTGVQNKRIKGLNATINSVYEQAAAISAEAKAAADKAAEEAEQAKAAQESASADMGNLPDIEAELEAVKVRVGDAEDDIVKTEETVVVVKETAEEAKETAGVAQQTAESIVNLVITTDKATTRRSSGDTVTATANVFRKGAKLTAEEVAELGVVRWYLNGTCVREDGSLQHTVNACDGTLKARLEV